MNDCIALLAETGSESTGLLLLGAATVLAGGALIFGKRLRRRGRLTLTAVGIAALAITTPLLLAPAAYAAPTCPPAHSTQPPSDTGGPLPSAPVEIPVEVPVEVPPVNTEDPLPPIEISPLPTEPTEVPPANTEDPLGPIEIDPLPIVLPADVPTDVSPLM